LLANQPLPSENEEEENDPIEPPDFSGTEVVAGVAGFSRFP